MKIGLISTAALFALASLGTAQTVRWTSPVLGYYFDSEAKSIQTIAGVPGSAAVEGGLAIGSKLDRAFVSPSRDYAFTLFRDSDRTSLVAFAGTQVESSRTLDDAPAGFDAAYFSPDGRTAVLLWKEDGRLQIWNGLPNAPSLASEVQALNVSSLAVSNSGRVAVADATGIRWLGEENGFASQSPGWSSLSLSASGDLAAANRETGQVAWISGDRTSTFAVPDVQAVAFSTDGSRLIAVSSKQVVSFDLAGGKSSAVACDCTLSTLDRMQGNTVFRVSAPQDGFMTLYDADGSEPRLTLVAAGGNQ